MIRNVNNDDRPSRHNGTAKTIVLINSVRTRLLHQLFFLEMKTESQLFLINDLSDFFRHRGLLEFENSRGLDKIPHWLQLSNTEVSPIVSEKQHLRNPYNCWHELINETKAMSDDYNALSHLYSSYIIIKLQRIFRIYKKCHKLIYEIHDAILGVLRNLYTHIQTMNNYQNDHHCPITQLKSVDIQKSRNQMNSTHVEKLTKDENEIRSDKHKNLEARYLYQHFIETANANIHKHMLKGLRNIIYALDSGIYLMLFKALLAFADSEQTEFKENVLYSEDHSSTTTTRLRGDQQLLKVKEDNLRKNLIKIYSLFDRLELFCTNHLNGENPKHFRVNSSIPVNPKIITGNEADKKSHSIHLFPRGKGVSFKNRYIYKSKTESEVKMSTAVDSSISNTITKNNQVANIKKNSSHRPKLFGGSLEEYIKFTEEPIPLIVRSCIRVIKIYGLHSQGIFRVSGSQIEILNLRDSFERGEDPLADVTDAFDMHSIAGVLKLYLRELRDPLFPQKFFENFISLIQLNSESEVITGMKNYFTNISKPVVIVTRYLFSFLNHLSQYASENMMDAFNLATSFGPTLMPAPEDKKQVHYQTLLNNLIKVVIDHHKEVFPMDLEGQQYDNVDNINNLDT